MGGGEGQGVDRPGQPVAGERDVVGEGEGRMTGIRAVERREEGMMQREAWVAQ